MTVSSPGSTAQNPYEKAFDSLESWSNGYLMQSLTAGAPPVAEYAAGGTASSFAQLSDMLAQIEPGVASGLYGGGGGIDVLA